MRYQQHKIKKKGANGLNVSSSPLLKQPQKLFVKLRLPLLESSLEKTVLVNGTCPSQANSQPEGETANAFLERMFSKHYERCVPEKTAQDFILKVLGFADYIDGEEKFTCFEYVQNCLIKGQTIQLSLTEREIDPEYLSEDFPDEEVNHLHH